MRVFILSLGCPKNLVDSEHMAGILKESNFEIVFSEEDAEGVIINTCAFINPAILEAWEEIHYFLSLKRKGKIKFLGVAGCLPERFRENPPEILKEVDFVMGIDDIPKVSEIVLMGLRNLPSKRKPSFIGDHRLPRLSLSNKPYYYVKIADGCDKNCSFCVIPFIRGKHRSRRIEDILEEVKIALNMGKKEIILVSQDTGYYGYDLYGKNEKPLLKLLKEIDRIEKDFYLRLMYLHPYHVDDELVDIIGEIDHMAPYLEIPIQHISGRVLKDMNRAGGKEKVIEAIERVREKLPEFFIRTEVIVGFPTETEDDFEELISFLDKVRFERIGVFKYFPEPQSESFTKLGKFLDEQLQEERFEIMTSFVMHHLENIQSSFVGKKVKVMIEEKDENNAILGRTLYDFPDIDFQVKLENWNNLKQGDILEINITGIDEHLDLIGSLS